MIDSPPEIVDLAVDPHEDLIQILALGGRSVAGLAPRDRNIAMVFQSYALYPYLSVYENIAFGLRARKVSQAEVDKQVAWASNLLDIDDYLGRYPRELSGGQRQRVAIGRAIVRDADLYLFDEPLSNLDAKLRDGMREEIKRLHGELGKTFIYVTHDQIEAMTLAERIVLLRDGVIAQSGAPLDLFERPDDTYVAGFLGSPPMNFVDVDVDASNRSMRLPDGQQIELGEGDGAGGPLPAGRLVWGIRPEHFSLGGHGHTLQAKLEVIQPTGSRSFGSFTIGGTHMVAELEAHAGRMKERDVTLAVALDRTVFFDSDTGAAIR